MFGPSRGRGNDFSEVKPEVEFLVLGPFTSAKVRKVWRMTRLCACGLRTTALACLAELNIVVSSWLTNLDGKLNGDFHVSRTRSRTSWKGCYVDPCCQPNRRELRVDQTNAPSPGGLGSLASNGTLCHM